MKKYLIIKKGCFTIVKQPLQFGFEPNYASKGIIETKDLSSFFF